MKLYKDMKKTLAAMHRKPQFYVLMQEEADDGMALVIQEQYKMTDYRIIVSWGGGWDHASMTLTNAQRERCPEWEEMCWLKNIFWGEGETVTQYHPAKSEYVNCHPFCLHLWKLQNCVLPTPPAEFVGVKS